MSSDFKLTLNALASEGLRPGIVNALHAAKNQLFGSLLFGHLFTTYVQVGKPDFISFFKDHVVVAPVMKVYGLASAIPSASLSLHTVEIVNAWAKDKLEQHAPMIFLAAQMTFAATLLNQAIKVGQRAPQVTPDANSSLCHKLMCQFGRLTKQIPPGTRVGIALLVPVTALVIRNLAHSPDYETASFLAVTIGHLFTTQVLAFCTIRAVTSCIPLKAVRFLDWTPNFAERVRPVDEEQEDPDVAEALATLSTAPESTDGTRHRTPVHTAGVSE